MVDGYCMLLHRKHGIVLARRIPITKWHHFYIWHDERGLQHIVREGSAMIEKMSPVNITPQE